jgi:OFA family oxalate/formate antiporter-like MFS transporter
VKPRYRRLDRVAARTLVAATVLNLAGGTLFAWSILLPSLTAEFGESSAAVSTVFSAALVTFAIVVVLAGGLTDTRSPRALAIVAGLAAGLGLGLSAAAPSLPLLAVGYGGVFGLGSGLGYVTAVSVAGTRFGAHRGLALGAVVGAYAAGPVVVGPLGTIAIDAVGWRPTLAVLAIAVASAAIAVAPWMTAAPVGDGAGDPRRSAQPTAVAGDASRGLWSLWALFLCATAPGLLAFAYATDIALERGMTPRAAGIVVALLAAGSLAGRLLAGPLSDRLGTLATTALTLLTLALAVTTLGWVPGAGLALVAMPVLGAAYGSISTLVPAATAELVRPERFGAAYGRVFSSWGVAGLLGPLAGGWLHGIAGQHQLAFQLSVVSTGLAFGALVAFAGQLRRRRLETSP